MINAPLLIRIEAADIACTRSHYAMLTESEIGERQYRSCGMDGVWVYVETRKGQRVGIISGLGLQKPADPETLLAALEWLQAEQAKSIRVRVTAAPGNAELVNWLVEANFKQGMPIHQWYRDTDPQAAAVILSKRRKPSRQECNFVIREIGPEDAGIFAEIIRVNYHLGKHTNLAWWEKQVGAEGIATFIAFDSEEPVGTGMVQGSGEMCVLGYGTTLKPYRKHGLQNAMIAARVAKARELGHKMATASTFGTDQSSRNLRRQGFALAGEVGVFTYPPKK